jgi:tRNA U34 5-methylaminomethyl-2-thiouridine-forming methyltransferase MnmC
MPVTARLSKAFYDRLGEEVANELVDWFNQVDATYRTDLRELNELNFARFDATLEQRVAYLDAKLEQRTAAIPTSTHALFGSAPPPAP